MVARSTSPPAYDDEGRPAIVMALASLGSAILSLTQELDIRVEVREEIRSQMNDLTEALNILSGQEEEGAEEKHLEPAEPSSDR